MGWLMKCLCHCTVNTMWDSLSTIAAGPGLCCVLFTWKCSRGVTKWMPGDRTRSTECKSAEPSVLRVALSFCKIFLVIYCYRQNPSTMKAGGWTQGRHLRAPFALFPRSMCTECLRTSCCALKEDPAVSISWFWPRLTFSRRTLPRRRNTFSKQPRWTTW